MDKKLSLNTENNTGISEKKTDKEKKWIQLINSEGLFLLIEKAAASQPERYPYVKDFEDILAYLRKKCPAGAIALKGNDDIGLEDVYRVIGLMTGFTAGQLRELMELDETIRAMCCLPEGKDTREPDDQYRKLLSKDPSFRRDLAWHLLAGIDTKAGTGYAGSDDPCTSNQTQALSYRIGYNLCGPILYDYVKWILNICKSSGIDRLYFLSRDGYVLKKIADIIIKRKGLRISTKYLYGSRKVFRADDSAGQELLREYMYQEMDLSDDNFALVDVQGTGASIERLSETLGMNIRTFYFFLLNLPDQKKNKVYFYSTKPKGLIETLCRAPHGVVTSYRKNPDGRIQPEFYTGPAESAQYPRLRAYTAGLCSFAEYITEIEQELSIDIKLRRVCIGLYDYLCHFPSKEVADYFGETVHDRYNRGDMEYAPLLTRQELEEIEKDPSAYRGGNLAYSILRTDLDKKVKDQVIADEKKMIRSGLTKR